MRVGYPKVSSDGNLGVKIKFTVHTLIYTGYPQLAVCYTTTVHSRSHIP